VEVENAEIPEKDYLVDGVAQAGRGVEPRDENYNLTKEPSLESAGSRVVWRLFGLSDSTSGGGDTGPRPIPRHLYIAAGGQEIAAAIEYVLEKPRVVRGLLLFDPVIEALPGRLVSRLHAVRCPGIVVVSRNSVHGSFSRMPNMSFRVVESAQPVELRSWQHLVEQMPHRYSMKSRRRGAE
jgi:hypothetical protein